MKIISPKYDYCAKELFRNEVVRNHFLSDVLEIPMEEIRSSRLLNTFFVEAVPQPEAGDSGCAD